MCYVSTFIFYLSLSLTCAFATASNISSILLDEEVLWYFNKADLMWCMSISWSRMANVCKVDRLAEGRKLLFAFAYFFPFIFFWIGLLLFFHIIVSDILMGRGSLLRNFHIANTFLEAISDVLVCRIVETWTESFGRRWLFSWFHPVNKDAF